MIIAFTGGYGVGKSTAVSFLRKSTEAEIRLVKFAGPLYDMQEYIYQRIESVYVRPKTFVKDRKLLQWLGTDFGRSIDENLWVKIWKAQASVNLAIGNLVVCDDCRFDNEAEAIKDMGGIIIKLTRNDNHKHAQGGTGIQNHASEAGVSQKYIDFTVENNHTVDAFRDKLMACYRACNL
jgi:hypothetical protein